jgi:hypothetical protein
MTSALFRARSTVVWLGLIIVTLVSFTVGADHGVGSGVALWVLALALIKVRYVGLDFMELRDAPLLLRGAFEGYCVVLWLVLAGMYLWL